MNQILPLLLLISSIFSLNYCQTNDFYENNWLNLYRSSKSWFKNKAEIYENVIKTCELKGDISGVCANQLIMMFNKIDHDEWAAKSRYYLLVLKNFIQILIKTSIGSRLYQTTKRGKYR